MDVGSGCDGIEDWSWQRANASNSLNCVQTADDSGPITAEKLEIADDFPGLFGATDSGTDVITLDGDSKGVGLQGTPVEPESLGVPDVMIPIVLGSSQTWQIDGDTSWDGVTVNDVTDPLNYDLHLQLGGDLYTTSLQTGTGTVFADGDGYLVVQNNPDDHSDQPTLSDTVLSGGAGLQVTATDANSGSIEAGLSDPDDVSIGSGIAHDGTLAVTGNVTLGSLASLDMFIDQPESTTYPPVAGVPPTPSYDFSQLTASGTVDLGQANLNVYLGTSSTSDCRDLVPGQNYTLLSAGTITGELDDNGTPISQGDTIALQNDCNDATYAPTVAIYYDRSSTPETVTAQVVDGGHAADLPVLTGDFPTISNTSPVAGAPLQATPGDWSEDPTSYDYDWYSCSASAGPDCNNVVGADAPTYTPTVADAGNTVEVCVSATNAYGSSTDEYCSDPTDPVALPPPPKISGPEPSITGNGQVGDTLTASPGSWSGSPTFAYQWQRCATQGSNCTNIPGATGSSYTLTSSDIGQYLRLEITATNIGGYTVATLSSDGQVTGPQTSAPPSTLTTSTTSIFSSTKIRAALTAIAHPSGKKAIAVLLKTGMFKTNFHAPTNGALTVTWTTTVTSGTGKHKTRKRVTIATASASANRAQTINVTVHLTRVGKTLLRKNTTELAISASEKFKPSGHAQDLVTKTFRL